MHKIRSLKHELLFRLVLPLIFFVNVDTVLTYFVTLHYVDKTYDRWLLDSAKSVTQEIRVRDGSAFVELPPAALAIFKWDESDKTYFKIISEHRKILAGDALVPDPPLPNGDWSHPIFFEDTMQGEPVRVVAMLVERGDIPEKIFIHVAETLNKRRAMMRDIFLTDLVPQILLILTASSYLLSGVKRGLKPLHALANEIAQRSPTDLEPIPEAHVFLEVQTLTNTINDLFKRLALAITSQQRFIANAAHQLRTPLAGLKLQAERAQREQDITAMKPALAQIQDCADRLSHMTTQLLVLASSEPIAGSHELNPINLCALAREICVDWVPKALLRKMELSYEGPERALWVLGDKILLREMLDNLLDNAITYGNEHGNILVRLDANPTPRLTVEDDGPGIADDEINKVFERFYRIPGSQGSGCGLGLPIVQEIAELHNARVTVSRVNAKGGTRIELIFADLPESSPIFVFKQSTISNDDVI